MWCKWRICVKIVTPPETIIATNAIPAFKWMADHSYYGWFIDFSFCCYCCCHLPLRVRSSIEKKNQHKSGLFLFDHDFDKNVLQDHFLQFSGLKLVHIVFHLNRTMCVRIPIVMVIVIVCIVLVITWSVSLSCSICCLLTNDVLCWHGHCICVQNEVMQKKRVHTPTYTPYTYMLHLTHAILQSMPIYVKWTILDEI